MLRLPRSSLCGYLLLILLQFSSPRSTTSSTKSNPPHHSCTTPCPLLLAAASNNLHALKKHLFQGVSLYQHDDHGTTALYYAAENNHIDIVQFILKEIKHIQNDGTTTDAALQYSSEYINAAPTTTGATPLYISIQEGHHAVFLLLLEHNADPTLPTTSGVAPIHAASYSGMEGYLKPLLLSSQAVRKSINKASPSTGHTALHMAALQGSHSNVQVLLTYDGGFTDCNVLGAINGATPLWYACSKGHAKVVRALLETCVGIDIDTPDSQQWTPFMTAAHLGYIDILQLLMDHKVLAIHKQELINAKSDYQTALLIAVHAQQFETVQYLLAQTGIAVNDRVQGGWNALMVACEVGSTEMVQALLHANADVRFRQTNGWSALHQASLGGHHDIVKLLLKKMTTSFINLEGNDHQSALSLAVWHNHPTVVKVLSRDGRIEMDKVIEHHSGRTAFHVAVVLGHYEIVEILSKNKHVGIQKLTIDKQTPLDLSRTYNRPKIENLMAKLIQIVEQKKNGKSYTQQQRHEGL